MSKFPKVDSKYYLYTLLLIALFLRLFNLNYEGLWNDELFTAYTAHPRYSIRNVLGIMRLDIHPPLHNLLCSIWSKLFSYNDTSLRVLNVLIGVWGVKSVFDLAKELFNKKVAWYAIIFAILNYYLINYSQEVRPYGLLFLLSNYSFYYFIKLVRAGFTLKNGIWYVVATTAMLYTHYFAIFVGAAQFCAFFFIMDWKLFKKTARKYVLTFMTPVLFFLLWVPIILENLNNDRMTWRDDATWKLIFKYPRDFFNDYILGAVSILLIVTTLFYLLSSKVYKHKRLEKFYVGNRFPLTILATWIVVYFSIPFLKSFFSETMMYNRYFMPLMAPILLLLAFYVSKIKSANTKNGILAVVIGYSLLVLFLKPSPYFTQTTTYREIAREAEKMDSDASIWYLSANPMYFDYYLRQHNFGDIRKRYDLFSELVARNGTDSYFVFLDLRLMRSEYKNEDDIPIIDGFERVDSKVFKNKSGLHSTKLIHYKKIQN